ncbi:MAG: glycerophosphodiester phosphodiesterase [Desulfurococcales archaeon]|nr:glycerophosphodiester phosphodiesterase [Desulfurococcales archaeon]
MDGPIIVGHRANSGRIVQFYKLSGVEYVEIDVRSENGEVMVGHGRPVINRATIIGKAWAWLDYKLFYRDPLLKARTLPEWLRIIQEKLPLKGVLLDVKNNVDPRALARELEKSGFQGELYASTEDHRLIRSLKEYLDAKVLASYSIMPYDIVECTIMSGADGVALRKDYSTREVVKSLHRAGLLVFAWTVNTVEEAVSVYGAGVDGIISDRPDKVRKALGGVLDKG